jgi:hypothetical protein
MEYKCNFNRKERGERKEYKECMSPAGGAGGGIKYSIKYKNDYGYR